MEKILRLFVTDCLTDDWPVKKRGNYDIENIPVVEHFDYDTIIICGGEPLLFDRNVERLVRIIAFIGDMTGRKRKVFLETSCCNFTRIDNVIKYLEGFVLTPRTKDDMAYFKQLNNNLLSWHIKYEKKQMRLNVMPRVSYFLPENLRMWDVTELETDDYTPNYEGVEFRRVARLWESNEVWYDFEKNTL